MRVIFYLSNEGLRLDLSENTSSSDQETLATPICFDSLENSESDCETYERENSDRFTDVEAGNMIDFDRLRTSLRELAYGWLENKKGLTSE